MLSKNKRPYDPAGLPPDKRLCANLQDIYANNMLPAGRIQEVLNDAAELAPRSVLRRHKGRLGPNTNRNLRRSFAKRVQWPQLYEANVRMANKDGTVDAKPLCFMLPHEYVEALARLGSKDVLMATDGLDPLSAAHLQKCEAKASAKLLPLGLWGDGVPCNYDRSESVEVFSLNLPGQAGQYKPLRLPITAFPRNAIAEGTWDDILLVVTWSLRYCAAGFWPLTRHDGSAWHGDGKRYAKAGTSLNIRACLVEVRGDWKMMAETFHFPSWNQKRGCCWRCTCTLDQAWICVKVYNI